MKEKLRQLLEKIRNPQSDDNEKEFVQHMNLTRLLFLVPFLIAALIFFLLSFK
jgi:hypothetical protein